MGGIIVLVKNCLNTFVNRICDDFTFGVLLKFDKSLFNFDRDVIYVSIYIPPEKSPFYDNFEYDCIECIEETIISNNLLDNELLLVVMLMHALVLRPTLLLMINLYQN